MLVKEIVIKSYTKLKNLLCIVDNAIFNFPTKNKKNYDFLIDKIINHGIPSALDFNFVKIKNKTLSFLENMRIENSLYRYKFAPSQKKENIYSSVYACLVYDLYDEIKNFSQKDKQEWIDYFDSFQNPEDGLWYDNNLINDHYNNSDWWGARHLAVHMIAAYSALGKKPKYKISYVEKYYDEKFLYSWLDSIDWNASFNHNNDVDNKFMNIVMAMVYNRDAFGDMKAEKVIRNLFEYLDNKVNPDTGMWGKYNVQNPEELSRCVQFAYHVLMPYFYDGRQVLFKDKIINLTLKTQNRLGGYGVKLNSSACEDIDSVDLLIHLADNSNEEVRESLKKAFVWILSNQNEDGGFVFRRNEPLWYGHEILTSRENESNMFATWFRTLSIVKIAKYFNINNGFKYSRVPGY